MYKCGFLADLLFCNIYKLIGHSCMLKNADKRAFRIQTLYGSHPYSSFN